MARAWASLRALMVLPLAKPRAARTSLRDAIGALAAATTRESCEKAIGQDRPLF
jgi:hypothetical protein